MILHPPSHQLTQQAVVSSRMLNLLSQLKINERTLSHGSGCHASQPRECSYRGYQQPDSYNNLRKSSVSTTNDHVPLVNFEKLHAVCSVWTLGGQVVILVPAPANMHGKVQGGRKRLSQRRRPIQSDNIMRGAQRRECNGQSAYRSVTSCLSK